MTLWRNDMYTTTQLLRMDRQALIAASGVLIASRQAALQVCSDLRIELAVVNASEDRLLNEASVLIRANADYEGANEKLSAELHALRTEYEDHLASVNTDEAQE
jgi:hypothetical protein